MTSYSTEMLGNAWARKREVYAGAYRHGWNYPSLPSTTTLPKGESFLARFDGYSRDGGGDKEMKNGREGGPIRRRQNTPFAHWSSIA